MIADETGRSRAMLGIAAIAGIAFFAMGYACIWLTRANHDVSILWVATAFATCVVLRNCRTTQEAALVLAAVFVAGIAANYLGGSSLPVAVAFSVINIVDVVVARSLTRPLLVRRFLTLSSGLRFLLLAGVIPSMAGAVLAGIALWTLGSAETLMGALGWFFANLLGFFIVAPLGMTISAREVHKLNLGQRKFEVAATLVTMLVVSVIIYIVPPFSPLFLIIPIGLWATYRFRLLGASAAILLISIAAFTAHALGLGPNKIVDQVQAIYVLQCFLAVCVMAFVPVAAFLNERDFHIALIERRRQRATQASKFKSQLLSHVTHEVRTPLSAIIGFSSMLESGLLTPEKAPEFAAIIARNGELLMRLHDDLLDFARNEAGALVINRENLNAASALAAVVQRLAPIIVDSATSPLVMDKIDAGLSLHVDPLRLAQIMNNLIGNAQKYGYAASPVIISARKLDNQFARIEIINRGPGIKPEHRNLIFQPFSRLEPGSAGGSGLGLSITKMLVEVHGGRIDFDSVPNEQTRFWVDLPLVA